MAGKSVKTIILRLLAAVSFFVAFVVLLCSLPTLHDSQSDRNALLSCIIVDCIGCVYNLLVLCIPEGSQLWKTVIVFDVIVNLLVGASIGVGWQMYAQNSCCDKLPFFCSKVLGALITSSFGFSSSVFLILYILHVSVDPFLVVGD